jgi:phosphate transport system substrate-binding protein
MKAAAAAAVAALALSACGGEEDAAGDIAISGSSTVAPISAIVADEFNFLGSTAQVTIDDPGTGDGFALFCEGATDIQDASRPIKEEEAQQCADAGIDYVELEIAFDGIAVLTSVENDAVECLTFADLYALVGPEAEGVDNWDDAEALASELGSTTDLPDAPLEVTAPGVESGTYDAFVELVLSEVADVTELRSDYSSQADDNSIIAGVEGSDSSLGFVGFAFASGAGEDVKPVEIDGGDGCVAPSAETIADGTYPVARSLYIYVSLDRVEANPVVGEYVDFYLSDTLAVLVEEAGYVPLPEARLAATRAAWGAAR